MGISANMMNDDLSSYWQKVAIGVQALSDDDMQHINVCHQCQRSFLQMLYHNHLKVSSEMMAAVTADDFRQEVVRALCLRAVAAGVGN